jgi:hypothetical protein
MTSLPAGSSIRGGDCGSRWQAPTQTPGVLTDPIRPFFEVPHILLATFPAAILLVQHRAPRYPSHLVAL